jgi:signal transduction histidine kinase
MNVPAPPASSPGLSLVYIVDDDADMRQTVADILALAGIPVEGFGSGAAALSRCAAGQPGLAVVDQRLPDTTGIALSAKLKSADPDLGVALLTGYASADNAIAAVGLVDEYLTKPVPPDELVHSVKAGLERTRLRRENRRLVARLRELNASLEQDVADSTQEVERLHQQAVADQMARERLQAQAERERLENRLHQAERLESLGRLAGGVAHDFNNLLAVILNCASFVAEATAGDQSVQADVQQLRTAAERAARLTRQLLIFGRQDSAGAETLDLGAILADVQSLLARSIGEDIELIIRPADALPLVRANRGQVEQVLVNLAVNARDAMPGGGTLTISLDTHVLDEDYQRLHPGSHPGRYVALAVSDTGEGMSPEVVARVFEPFFTTKPLGKGTGLGLATVHGIVTEAGGTLAIESEPGSGTTVRAYFPTADTPASPAAITTTTPATSSSLRGQGETIMIVEDEPAVLQTTARMLTRNDYTVLPAATGAQALSMASGHQLDLLVTDLVMPKISGPDLARRIQEIQPGLPVLFTSGYSHDALKPGDTLAEKTPVLQKPFTEQALLENARAALAQRGGRPATRPQNSPH